MLDLTRPRSADASISTVQVHEWRADMERRGTQLSVTQSAVSACGWSTPAYTSNAGGSTSVVASGALSACWVLAMSPTGVSQVVLDATTNHSLFCSLANHACVGNSRIELVAPPQVSWFYRLESGDRGELQASCRPPRTPLPWAGLTLDDVLASP